MDILEDGLVLENVEPPNVDKTISETEQTTGMDLNVQETSEISYENNLAKDLEKYKNQLNNYNDLIEKVPDNNMASTNSEQDNNIFSSLLTQSSTLSTDDSIINSQKYSAESGQIASENMESDSEIYASENLMLSESEEENHSPVKHKRKSIKKILDSDSEDDQQDHDGNNVEKKETFNKISSLIDSESEVEATEDQQAENVETESTSKPQKSKYSSLIDSDSESENEGQEERHVEEGQLPKKQKIKEKKSKPPQRDSAKAAMDNIKAIKSETQRLARENYINIPYHKPKHHTFQEFITRKTLGKVQSSITNAKNPKLMTKEDLVKYAKYLEERAKEATEFFKSESEDELVPIENNKENIDVNVQNSEQDTEAVNAKEMDENPTAPSIEPMETEKSQNENAEESKEETTEPPAEVEQNNILTPAITEEKTSQMKLIQLKKLLIEENSLTNSPTLHGSPKMMIDLETGDLISPNQSGVDNLLQRFIKNSAKRKSNSQGSVKILSTENGTIEMTTVNINLSSERSDVEQKPGSAYVKLKNDLKSIIVEKRKAELMKRMQNEVDYYENEKDKCDGEEDEEEVAEEVENEIEDDEFCINEEDEEIVNNEEPAEVEADDEELENYADEEELENDADDELEDNDDENDESEDEEEPENKPKRRIIKAFDDSDEENNDGEHEKLEALDVGNKSVLWVDEEEKQNSDEENELLGLCSGRFGPTQKSQIPTTVISQIPTTQFREDMDENELLEMCSGKFNEPEKDQEDLEVMTPADRLNLESSEDEYEVNEKKQQNNTKEKRKRKLGFSDDEEDIVETLNQENEVEDNENEELDEDLELEPAEKEADNDHTDEDQPETYIDYDSEENEIEVQMTKKERLKKVGDFFEKEAELSESEWGSADEDEKDMDRYDIELGDEDEFDKEQIRSELGQIHLRKLLDQDIREVKKIQDMLFEDEENAGVGRERKFKWKNADNDFSLHPTGDDPTGNDNNDDDNIADEENEELWRKMRHEREVLLQEKKLEVTDEVSLVASSTATESCIVSSATAKKITVIKSKTPNTSFTDKINSPFLISKKTQKSSVRGSFLVRDTETLNKLAQLTKTGTEGDGIQIKGSGRNFVFATIDSEVIAETNMKRKSPGSSKDCDLGNRRKKQKLSTDRRNELIDHLV